MVKKKGHGHRQLRNIAVVLASKSMARYVPQLPSARVRVPRTWEVHEEFIRKNIIIYWISDHITGTSNRKIIAHYIHTDQTENLLLWSRLKTLLHFNSRIIYSTTKLWKNIPENRPFVSNHAHTHTHTHLSRYPLITHNNDYKTLCAIVNKTFFTVFYNIPSEW